EPGYARAARRGPDAELVLLHAAVPLEGDAAIDKSAHARLDVIHSPAEHGVGGARRLLHERHAQPAELAGERAASQELQPERFAVEVERAVEVRARDERHQLVAAQHRPSPAGAPA